MVGKKNRHVEQIFPFFQSPHILQTVHGAHECCWRDECGLLVWSLATLHDTLTTSIPVLSASRELQDLLALPFRCDSTPAWTTQKAAAPVRVTLCTSAIISIWGRNPQWSALYGIILVLVKQRDCSPATNVDIKTMIWVIHLSSAFCRYISACLHY